MADSGFVESHPIVYWNLVWFLERANIENHLPDLLCPDFQAKYLSIDMLQDTERTGMQLILYLLWTKIHQQNMFNHFFLLQSIVFHRTKVWLFNALCIYMYIDGPYLILLDLQKVNLRVEKYKYCYIDTKTTNWSSSSNFHWCKKWSVKICTCGLLWLFSYR